MGTAALNLPFPGILNLATKILSLVWLLLFF